MGREAPLRSACAGTGLDPRPLRLSVDDVQSRHFKQYTSVKSSTTLRGVDKRRLYVPQVCGRGR